MDKITVVELFAGIGSQTQALKNIGVEHEVIGISEIDKYAIKSYEAIHGQVNNFGDITKIEKLPYCDLLTYSFPCQDISIAGKKEGIKEGTRSGLLYEVERLLEEMEVKPKYLLLENVDNLLGKSHKKDFDKWLDKLQEIGYENYFSILNSKDFGIAQSRKRVFVVSIRKDLKQEYIFPKGFDNGLRLKDFLESKVDERFIVKKHINERKTKNYLQYDNSGKGYSSQAARAYYLDGFMCTLPKCNGGDKTQVLIDEENNIVRRITPLEAWRLTGFRDEHYYKAESSGQTMGSLYGQAGNSIVVPVLEAIFTNLFKGDIK